MSVSATSLATTGPVDVLPGMSPMGSNDQIVMCGFDVVQLQGIGTGTSGVGSVRPANFVNSITAKAKVGRRCNRVGVANAILAFVKCQRCFARACAASYSSARRRLATASISSA